MGWGEGDGADTGLLDKASVKVTLDNGYLKCLFPEVEESWTVVILCYLTGYFVLLNSGYCYLTVVTHYYLTVVTQYHFTGVTLCYSTVVTHCYLVVTVT